MIFLREHMLESEARRLVGKKVDFTVIRDGTEVARRGTIQRISAKTIQVGPYFYAIREILRPKEVGGGL